MTKGAYHERLVALDTGGALHESFNQAGTDIMIDGEAIQIKATDSVSYIESVDEGVPVIATTEAAGVTDAIDSGYTNAELTESVELALGGTVIDVADAGIDAALVGLGGLGFFAFHGVYVVLEPLDFIARLADLVPKPRVNLTRFHGVFAPNNRYRAFTSFGCA